VFHRIVTAVVAAIQSASVFRLPPPPPLPFSRPSVWSSSHSATSFVYSCRHGWRTGVTGPGAQSFISTSISARASAIPLTPPPIRLFRLRRLVPTRAYRLFLTYLYFSSTFDPVRYPCYNMPLIKIFYVGTKRINK